MPKNMTSDGEAMKNAKGQERDLLNWQLARTDYLAKLLDSGLTETTELEYSPISVMAVLKPHKLTPDQIVERQQQLKSLKASLLERLGIII